MWAWRACWLGCVELSMFAPRAAGAPAHSSCLAACRRQRLAAGAAAQHGVPGCYGNPSCRVLLTLATPFTNEMQAGEQPTGLLDLPDDLLGSLLRLLSLADR